MNDSTLVARFEDGTLGLEELGHREHVRLAWIYLREAPFEIGAARFCTNLRRFADAKGKGGLYHATITWAYLVLVNERIHTGGEAPDFAAFAAANPDLIDHKTGAVAARYEKSALESPIAKRVFLLPRSGSRAGDVPT